MTSLSRRKRLTTVRRTTLGQTIASLLGVAWLAAGSAIAADSTAGNPAPPALYPLYGPVNPAVPRDQPGLKPVVKPAQPPAGPTIYFQKDAAPAAQSEVVPAVHQPEQGKIAPPTPPVSDLPKSAINTVPPMINQIPAQSEAQLQQTIVREVKEAPHTSEIFSTFPTTYYDDFPKDAYVARTFQPTVERVEPMYVCYGRLYFEDKNSERYGWDLGMVQPLVSIGKFYLDVLSLPYQYGTRPCQRYEADAGYCLPGDPVPYLIYPVELSLTGAILEAGTTVGLAAIFP